ncbi:MAG: magnesium protoporphyrin IX methyltransferase [Pseudomonadota bacterium]
MSLAENQTTSASPSYARRRAELTDYFDRTAAETWARLTSDAPVSRIRATVRAGRDRMRATLLSWLPEDIEGLRILDAGCGTGAMSVALAERGAEVVGIDVAGSLVALAEKRAGERLTPAAAARITWHAGDMLDPALGHFDHVIAMDSLIHYRQHDMADAVAKLAVRAQASVLMTFAPRTRLLALMHVAGTVFPRSDRSPRIEPIPARRLERRLAERSLSVSRRQRVTSGFYISEAAEVRR